MKPVFIPRIPFFCPLKPVSLFPRQRILSSGSVTDEIFLPAGFSSPSVFSRDGRSSLSGSVTSLVSEGRFSSPSVFSRDSRSSPSESVTDKIFLPEGSVCRECFPETAEPLSRIGDPYSPVAARFSRSLNKPGSFGNGLPDIRLGEILIIPDSHLNADVPEDHTDRDTRRGGDR